MSESDRRPAPRADGTFAALLRFDLRVGVRLALQALAPAVAAAIGAAIILFEGFPLAAVAMLFGEEPSAGARTGLVALLLAVAAAAAPRVCHGRTGWMRHLPVSGRAQRRAAQAALTLAQVPVLAGLSLAALAVTPGRARLLVDVLGLTLGAAAASLAVMPVERRRLVAPLAAVASALCLASGATLPLGAATLLVADGAAGALDSRSGAARRRASGPGSGPLRFGFRVARRALGARLVSAFLVALLPLAAAALFLTNNELGPQQRGLALRLAGGTAVVVLLARLAGLLAVRRPTWPWVRSLPWSSARRARADAVILGAHALPLVALTAAVAPGAAAPLLGALPLIAALAAASTRRAPERRTGAAGEVLTAGLLVAGGVALQPLLAAAALLATPWALAGAAERERGLVVSRWLERHHLAVGDPQAWSA